jgi:hypothetical protein
MVRENAAVIEESQMRFSFFSWLWFDRKRVRVSA